MSYQDGAMVSGTVHSINVGKHGVEINVTNAEIQKTGPEDRPYFTCRIDRSSANKAMMLDIATQAMIHKLTVTLIGEGDDRDDTLEFTEVRVLGSPPSA